MRKRKWQKDLDGTLNALKDFFAFKGAGFTDKQRKAMQYALAQDLALLIGQIPVIGDIVEDIIEDSAHIEIDRILSSGEYKRFLKNAKWTPLETIAMYMTLKEE